MPCLPVVGRPESQGIWRRWTGHTTTDVLLEGTIGEDRMRPAGRGLARRVEHILHTPIMTPLLMARNALNGIPPAGVSDHIASIEGRWSRP